MLSDNIKRLRRRSGLTQEELAAKLCVVRQTVSKWENSLSVPDADLVVRMAEIFNVSAGELLGNSADAEGESLAADLERANALLAEKTEAERRARLVARKRALITALCFAALLTALLCRNEAVSCAAVAACFLAAVFTLWCNLALLTGGGDKRGLRAVRFVTVFDAALTALAAAAAVLSAFGVFSISAGGEKIAAASVVFVIMAVSGIISPRLPFNRHTGLRLPWTVADTDAWLAAHRSLGFWAIPVALLYLAAAFAIEDFEAVTLAAVIAWLGVPSLVSLYVYLKKMRGGSAARAGQ